MNERLKWLKNQLTALELEGMIVSNPANVKYLTGLDAEGIFLITPKENAFITDSRYIEDVNNSITVDQEIAAYNSKELASIDYEMFFEKDSNIGFEESYVTYADYEKYMRQYKVNLSETNELIEKQRSIKDEKELEYIKKACEITDKAFEYIIKNIKVGMTERQVAFEIQKYMIEHGADGLAFDTIVASGANSSKPHAVPTDRVIKQGDTLLFDMGAKYKGYCADMSRTVFVGYSDYKIQYEFVLEQQRKISNSFKDGANIKTVIKQAEQDYEEADYEVMHAFGHSLGLDVHESPVLRSKVDQYLKENMVLAIEPGIYEEKKYGIRIEDTYLVTLNGIEQLTKSNKKLTIIDLIS